MRWILLSVYVLSGALLALIVLAVVFVEETKPFVDLYANHAGVLGLLVSIVGFTLTVWTVYETLKVSTKAQKETAAAVDAARKETRELLGKIRVKMMGDTCEQASLFASEARHAVRSGFWLRAVEKCHDARLLALRLLTFQDITGVEHASIRAVAEDLATTIGFIERNRLKAGAPSGMPNDKVQPLDSLLVELEKVRSRLLQELLEVTDVDSTAS